MIFVFGLKNDIVGNRNGDFKIIEFYKNIKIMLIINVVYCIFVFW